MPAGASSSLIIADEEALDTPMDYESVPSVGAQLGSASVIILDDSVGMDWLVNKTVKFFKHESCGKCTPCREGTYWMKHITNRIQQGKANQGDVDLLYEVAGQIKGKCLCALGEFSTEAVMSGIDRFRADFDKKISAAAQPMEEAVQEAPSTMPGRTAGTCRAEPAGHCDKHLQ
jgi:NADH-quinone oxidoreductase subunit F